MTCIEAEPHVSAVCDGEPIPAEAAEHISTCAACRTALAEYGQIGTELRVAAAMNSETPPPLLLPQRRRGFDFLWYRVPVPRFALAALVVAVVAAAASVPLVRAQQRPLWFQFGYTLQPGRQMYYQVAKPGFDETTSTMAIVNGAHISTVLRIRVESVWNDDVVLRWRAVPGKTEPTSDGGYRFEHDGGMPAGVSLKDVPAIHYRPGQEVMIPIEGGGTIYMKGDVHEQQPKIAFNGPLEPPSNYLIMRGPVLVSENEVLAAMSGGGATADLGTAVTVGAGKYGTFLFALKPFPGSVQGAIEWGQMTFTLSGRPFHLVAAAPLASGEQPRPVWVRHDPTPAQRGSIGTVRLGE